MNDITAAAAAAGGGPSNFGKVGDAALADADPLGVNTAVTFDDVGGLDTRALYPIKGELDADDCVDGV